MNSSKKSKVIYHENNTCQTIEQDLIMEEPLAIQVEGEPYSVVMRTPGDELFHVAGFCLAEGLVDNPNDFATVGHCPDMDANVAQVTLLPERKQKVGDLLKRRGFVSQTSCGICGKELIQDLDQILTPIKDQIVITIKNAIDCVNQLPKHQQLYEKTQASHATLLFNSDLQIVSAAEDVGRHNALDKAIGKAFMGGNISHTIVAVLSSRISYELVQKAARAQIPLVIGMSRPTTLAVELGRTLNMTIACFRKNRLSIFCGEERIDGEYGDKKTNI